MPNGTLQVYTALADGAAPLAGATVFVYDAGGTSLATLVTDAAGAAPVLSLPAPDKALSLDETATQLPYALYDLAVEADGWQPVQLTGVQIFDGETTVARLSLLPVDAAIPSDEENTAIPAHNLTEGDGGSGATPIPCPPGTDEDAGENTGEDPGDGLVLDEVIIPTKITVHLGAPSANVSNVSVGFQAYIANVASSEVYPTWPEQALRANILAQISLALNRIYTEWYPSRGYSFNITGSPSYDQAYVRGRTVYAVMERLTAELFSTYVRKTGRAEPFFTEYCDGKLVNCPGMKQWGTVTRANEGLNALQILRYYYGNDVQLVTTARIASIPESYPGTPLRLGSTGTAVSVLQKQLSRIAKDYPSFGKPAVTGTFDAATQSSVRAFQKQFSLTQDGVVGRSTWYKISYIYVSVKDLAELTSEGEALTGAESTGIWPGTVLRLGSTGKDVELLQFWLQGLAQYQSSIPTVAVDGNFGAATQRSVRAFQASVGITQDGVVGQATWEQLYRAYTTAQSDAGGSAYPGTALRQGNTGISVRQVQFWLRLASTNYSALSPVAVDGNFGASTAAAVRAFQALFGLTADGIVGRGTWAKLNEVTLAITNNLVDANTAPGVFTVTTREGSSGTAVRAVQYYLRLLAAYDSTLPTVTVDGVFGARTTAAVRAWQTRAGLTADGIVGRITWQSIYTAAATLAPSGPVSTLQTSPAFAADLVLAAGSTGAETDWVRQTLDYLALWVDSIQPPGDAAEFDETLQDSVKSAQRYFGLPETGIVSDADWRVFNAGAMAFYQVSPAAPSPEPAGVWPGYTLAQGSAGPAVLQAQQWLNALAAVNCTNPFVPEDGLFGATTLTALESYQISAGLTPLGVLDLPTWESLQRAASAQ